MDNQTFFDHERQRYADEISKSFEVLLDTTNSFNRRLEELTVPSIRKEFRTIADLWVEFQALMKESQPYHPTSFAPQKDNDRGMPGTGGFNLAPQDNDANS